MKKPLQLVVALLLLAASVFLFSRSTREQRQSKDFPDGVAWLCLDCKSGFETSLDEVNVWANDHPGEGYTCPHCKKTNTARANKCPLGGCGKFYTGKNLVIDEKVCCPVCKKPLP